ncbi:hypothetical protein BCR36DRAFT_371858 [Piromyces finnis]|uniref:Uncharacterized protein n=1 Tax=Piromyces finnis TaxID=1754191 RepID=A0A1Y1V510_9FUNG|nr:hypothetical protein BCR36DRAFT_371858 [Piromyces finnis]|eukprot:ORX47375.1 hypothetical protein BCR36DRAFT_371858 [Piromyces finnis]
MTQKLFEKTSLPNNICVIDDKYISEETTTFYYRPIGNFMTDYHVEDANNNELYKHKYNSITGNSALLDPETDEKVFEFKSVGHLTKPSEIVITSMKDDKEIEKITSTEKNEIIEVKTVPLYKECFIYYGRKKENGILICKFSSSKFLFSFDFKIDIIPGVDTLFILLIIIQVFRSNQARNAAIYAAS